MSSVGLSVIVLTCNQRDLTMRLLESLRQYIADHDDVEVVLVDNGSADQTVADVKAWMNVDCPADGRIRICEMGRNVGVAAGRNAGLRMACGDKILLLDNDTIADAGVIEECRRYLDENPGCGVCAPALVSPSGEVQASAKPFPGLGIKIAHLLCRGRELRVEREELLKRHPFYVIGAFQMFTRHTLDAVGLLDEHIFYGPEDADFCMRVRATGQTVDYLPHLRMIHDWRRATRRSPFSRLAIRHALGLAYFYLKGFYRNFFC